MVAVHVRKQNQVDIAEPRVVAAGQIVRGVVQQPHAGRILENHRSVVRAQLAGMGAYRRDLHVLSESRGGEKQKGECCTSDLHRFLQE